MKSLIKKISIVISSSEHPINTPINSWIKQNSDKFELEVVRDPYKLEGGDICFLLSCSVIVPSEILKKYRKTLVIHASDLPLGRGWSPHIWQILNGEKDIVVSLIEASEKIDEGDIWNKLQLKVPNYFLYDQIISLMNHAHIDLINFAIENYETVMPIKQDDKIKPTYFPKRTPADSEISAYKSIEAQFDKMRVSDKNRFPSFFYLRGHKFKIILERYDD